MKRDQVRTVQAELLNCAWAAENIAPADALKIEDALRNWYQRFITTVTATTDFPIVEGAIDYDREARERAFRMIGEELKRCELAVEELRDDLKRPSFNGENFCVRETTVYVVRLPVIPKGVPENKKAND